MNQNSFELGQRILVAALAGDIERRSGDRRGATKRVLVALGRRPVVVIATAAIARARRSPVVVVVVGRTVVVVVLATGVTPGWTAETTPMLGRL